MSWIDCTIDNDYEIFTEYPFQIRKKSNGRIIKESIGNDGYVSCHLNLKAFKKHRIIATQFLPNPDNLPEIDHINAIRNDNRLQNLRWVSHAINARNRAFNNNVEAIYEDELPDGSIQILNHNDYTFEDYYIDMECNIYRYNGARYQRLSVYPGNKVHMTDIDNIRHTFSVNGLRRAFL